MNSQAYSIATENELAEILSNYNTDFVYSIVTETMKKRFQIVPVVSPPNVVGEWEQNFKAILSQYGSESHAEILRVREETYKEIINTICNEYKLNFTIDDSIDVYSAAFYLYDLFACRFTEYLIYFIANFIYKERSSIYETGLSEFKKNKDSSTIYGKKIYKDIKIAVINANIDYIISEIICNMDIPFYAIISIIFGNNSDLKKFIFSIISAGPEFFEEIYKPILNSDIRPELITAIRFKLQEIAIAHDQIAPVSDMIVQNNKEEN